MLRALKKSHTAWRIQEGCSSSFRLPAKRSGAYGTFAVINEKIRIGHTSFHVSVSVSDLEGLSEEDFVSVFDVTFKRLKDLGYDIWESSWDVDGFMVEIPKR